MFFENVRNIFNLKQIYLLFEYIVNDDIQLAVVSERTLRKPTDLDLDIPRYLLKFRSKLDNGRVAVAGWLGRQV